MAANLVFKRGSTFRARCTYTPPEGGAPSLTGAVVASELRNRGYTLIQPLAVEVAPDGMSFDLSADETETASWPVTTLYWDVRIELAGDVIYTETMQLNVIPNITAAPAPVEG